MSSLLPKFLLDENVRVELYRFLRSQGIDVKLSPKGATNGQVSKVSLAEARVLVTNDKDFTEYLVNRIFGVIWLRISQDDPDGLIKAFSNLLKSKPSLRRKIITLNKEGDVTKKPPQSGGFGQ